MRTVRTLFERPKIAPFEIGQLSKFRKFFFDPFQKGTYSTPYVPFLTIRTKFSTSWILFARAIVENPKTHFLTFANW